MKLSQLNSAEQEDKTILVYPHQLKANENGVLNVIVKQSYFKGTHYLIESVFENTVLFFENASDLESETKISLSLQI